MTTEETQTEAPLSFQDAAAQAEVDLAPAEETPVAEAAPATEEPAPTNKDTDLLTAEEETALRETAKNDPEQLVAGFKKAFYGKTQTLAEEKRALAKTAEFQKALLDNPDSTLADLAKQHGYTLTKPTPVAPPAEVEFDAEQVVAAELGEDLAFLAPQLTRAVTKLAEHITGRQLKPTQEQTAYLSDQAARSALDSLYGEFEKTNPGWKEHLPAMDAMSQKFPYTDGTDRLEYMSAMLRLSTPDSAPAGNGQKTADVVAKLTKAAAASDEINRPALTDSRAKVAPPGLPTFMEAAEAAERGEVWD